MKKFFTMALMSLVFVACNKEESKETPKEEVVSIEGTWLPEKGIRKGETVAVEESDCYKKSTFTYSGGKYKWVIYNEDKNGDCKLDEGSEGVYLIPESNKILLENKGEFTFSISGNTLTMVSSKGNTYIFKRK